jgi:hypothetical protein
MKPQTNNIGTLKLRQPPQIVANQEKTFTPVGTAIIIVAAEK